MTLLPSPYMIITNFGLVTWPWSTIRRGYSPPFSYHCPLVYSSQEIYSYEKQNIKHIYWRIRRFWFLQSPFAILHYCYDITWSQQRNFIFWFSDTKFRIFPDSVFTSLLSYVEFRTVKPSEYKLFQAADFACTIELLAEKASQNQFAKSEIRFFGTISSFKKDFLKPFRKKLL